MSERKRDVKDNRASKESALDLSNLLSNHVNVELYGGREGLSLLYHLN
jgi:hypothetical protein